MNELQFLARDEADTQRLGRILAQRLPPRITVALCGTLGAGKTRLVQAVAVACGVEPERVVSPTFTLCHEYRGDRPIYHLDLYRIRDEDELLQLGFEEYFDSDAITFVEWADRFPDQLPRARLEIQIDVLDATARRFHLRSTTTDLDAVLQGVADRLAH